MGTDGGDSASAWVVHGERVIYDNPWVQLSLSDVELPGGERFEHHVVRLKAAAMVVLVDDADRVLMLWRHRFVVDRWGWELPGGLVDDGESPAGAAARELLEETGYQAATLRHVTRFQPMVGMVDSWHDVYVGEGPVRVAEPTEATEMARMEWVPLAEIPGLIADGRVWNSGTLVGVLHVIATRAW